MCINIYLQVDAAAAAEFSWNWCQLFARGGEEQQQCPFKNTDTIKSIVAGNSQKRQHNTRKYNAKNERIGSGTSNAQTKNNTNIFDALGFLFLSKMRSWSVNVLKYTPHSHKQKSTRNINENWLWFLNETQSHWNCISQTCCKQKHQHNFNEIPRKNRNYTCSTMYPIAARLIAFIWIQFMGNSIEFDSDSTILVIFFFFFFATVKFFVQSKRT